MNKIPTVLTVGESQPSGPDEIWSLERQYKETGQNVSSFFTVGLVPVHGKRACMVLNSYGPDDLHRRIMWPHIIRQPRSPDHERKQVSHG
ncbi:unnamed protein product [Withania somnifera]